MTTKQKETIWDEFYSKKDREFLVELVGDWLSENGYEPEAFEFSITVEWEHDSV